MYDIEEVKKIDWSMIEIDVLGGDLADELIVAINKSMKYMMDGFWRTRAFEKEVKAEYLSMKGTFDKVIRPSIYASKVILIALKFKIYNRSAAGCAEFEVRDRCVKLLRSCAYHHVANKQNGWGGEESTIGHVYELANTAWIAWDSLNSRDKQLVVNMVEHEANILINAEPRFDFNAEGRLIDSSVSSIFYNREVASLLRIATMMLSNHEMNKIWTKKMKGFYNILYKMQSDDASEQFNVNNEGNLISYSAKSPYAISQIASLNKAIALSWIANETIPEGVIDNFETIYKSFYKAELDEQGRLEGQFVTFDKKNRPLAEVNAPDGYVGGKATQSAFYGMDMMAYCLGLDSVVAPSSREWAKVRMRDIQHYQKNGRSKYCMAATQTGKITHGECSCSNLIDTYVSLFIYIATKKVKETTKADKYKNDKARRRKK